MWFALDTPDKCYPIYRLQAASRPPCLAPLLRTFVIHHDDWFEPGDTAHCVGIYRIACTPQ